MSIACVQNLLISIVNMWNCIKKLKKKNSNDYSKRRNWSLFRIDLETWQIELDRSKISKNSVFAWNIETDEKSLAEATDQVQYFLNEKRKKEDWDTIATLKSSLNPASMEGENFIYSALDGWHREKMELNKLSRVEILPSNENNINTKSSKSKQVSKRGTTHSTTPLLQWIPRWAQSISLFLYFISFPKVIKSKKVKSWIQSPKHYHRHHHFHRNSPRLQRPSNSILIIYRTILLFGFF